MADEPDKDSKTEDPSEKKISDALRKGNVPFSREPALLASVMAMLIIAAFMLGPKSLQMTQGLAALLEQPHAWRLDSGSAALHLLQQTGRLMLAFLVPLFTVFVVAAVVASVAQNPPRLAPKRVKPELSRLSLKKGAKRLFGAQGWVEFAKACFKFTAISIIVAVLLRSETGHVMNTVLQDPRALPAVLLSLSLKLLSAVVLAAVVLALADVAWSRRHWWMNLRMTRQEVKDEHKQLDGDPIVKARRLSLARDRLRRSMLAAVPKATVVITNPTHYAVALRYDGERDAAPVVVAKGQNLIALKIREIARENDVPIVENRSLARALHKQVEVDQMIPPEFYAAVAEIIHYVMNLRRQGVAG